jgi:WD40 repeat protein
MPEQLGSGRRWAVAIGAVQPKSVRIYPASHSPVLSVAVGQVEGRLVIVSGGADGTVRVWEAATGEPVGAPLTGHTGPVFSVAVGPGHPPLAPTRRVTPGRGVRREHAKTLSAYLPI